MITTYTYQTYTRPAFIQPAYSVNGITVASNKTSEPNHRFVWDIYVDGVKVGRLKTLPSYLTYSSVEISDMIKNYVENEVIHSQPSGVPQDQILSTKDMVDNLTIDGGLVTIKVICGEEYKVNGVLTLFNGLDVEGEPAVYVCQFHSTYQAMDVNNNNSLYAESIGTGNQLNATQYDLLPKLNQAFGLTGDYVWVQSANIHTYDLWPFDNNFWRNSGVEYLSNSPLNRDIQEGLPTSVSYLEGQTIYLNGSTRFSDDNEFDSTYLTLGRAPGEYDENPLYRKNYNSYRNRVHTVGYEFIDPNGDVITEVKYQPESDIFGARYNQDFLFDKALPVYAETPNFKYDEFNQLNINTSLDYLKYEYFKNDFVIQMSEGSDYGDLYLSTDVDRYLGCFTESTPGDSVSYMDNDEICNFKGPTEILVRLKEGSDPQYSDHPMNTCCDINKLGYLPDGWYLNGAWYSGIPSPLTITFREPENRIGNVFFRAAGSNSSARVFYEGVEIAVLNSPSESVYFEMTGTSNEYTVDLYIDPSCDFWSLNQQPVCYLEEGELNSTSFEPAMLPVDYSAFTIDYNSAGDSKTATYTTQAYSEYFNNKGTGKNLAPGSIHADIVSGSNFFIPEPIDVNDDGIIVGVDNNLGDYQLGRYSFIMAPSLKVYSFELQRFLRTSELEQITGRSLESVNYRNIFEKPVLDILNCDVLNVREDKQWKEIGITWTLSEVGSATAAFGKMLILPSVYYGRSFTGMTPPKFYTRRHRVMYGNDKSLRGAKSYKVKTYDNASNMNLIYNTFSDSGSFTENTNGFVTSGGIVPLVGNDYQPYLWSTSTQGFQFGTAGDGGGQGQGFSNNVLRETMNIPSPIDTVLLAPSLGTSMNVSAEMQYLSYAVQGNNQSMTYDTDYENPNFMSYVSCMVFVSGDPQPSDPSNPSYIYFENFPVNGSGGVSQQVIYRPEDCGKWVRVYRAAIFPKNATTVNFGAVPRLRLDASGGVNNNLWDGREIYISDLKVSFDFSELEGLTERDDVVNHHYGKELRQTNINEEPHYNISSDLLRNEAYSVHWLNPYGAWDNYRFKGRSIKEVATSRERRGTGLDKTGNLQGSYVQSLQSYGGSIDYKVNANDIYELTSTFLTQEEREWMEDLIISPKAFIYDEHSNGFMRVNILTKKYTTINKNNQKLYQLKLEVSVSAERRTQQVLGKY